MITKPNVQAQTAFPLLGLLGIVFITLKLTGHIAWSWWWVLAPFWVPSALAALILAMLGAYFLIYAIFYFKGKSK